MRSRRGATAPGYQEQELFSLKIRPAGYEESGSLFRGSSLHHGSAGYITGNLRSAVLQYEPCRPWSLTESVLPGPDIVARGGSLLVQTFSGITLPGRTYHRHFRLTGKLQEISPKYHLLCQPAVTVSCTPGKTIRRAFAPSTARCLPIARRNAALHAPSGPKSEGTGQ
jgi:hypothetical protein